MVRCSNGFEVPDLHVIRYMYFEALKYLAFMYCDEAGKCKPKDLGSLEKHGQSAQHTSNATIIRGRICFVLHTVPTGKRVA